MKKHTLYWILPLIAAALVLGCPNEPEYTLKAVELAAGPNVDVGGDDTGAQITFTGASGLSLTAADFTVTGGGTIASVTVDGAEAKVTVSFAANADVTEKTYTVGIASGSSKIKGGATVTITQAAAGETRRALLAGPAVTAAAGDTTAYTTFTNATGLTTMVSAGTDLGTADFTVSTGATVSNVSISGDTATVTITFPANTNTTAKTYTVGISPSSTVVRGSGTVTVTQAAYVILQAFYVSFSTGNDDNAGTEAAPWKTIAKVNAQTFQPGEAILFKTGDTWTWNGSDPSLAPQGSGEAGNPIRISSYGTGAKPILEGKGLVDNVIHLHNQQYWEISNLEISNMVDGWTNPMARDDAQGNLIKNKDLRAIYVSGDNGETLHGFNLRDLYIHDVTGELNWIGGGAYINNPNPVPNFPGSNNQTGWDDSKTTGAIVFYALAGNGTNATIFDNITVENSVFLRNSFCAFTTKQYHGGSGGPQWADPIKTTYPYNDNTNWKPHTNITVRGNYIDQVGFYHGNGIYLTSVKGALVENNVIKDPGVCGIEMYWADSITVQHNEVYGSTAKGGGNDTNGIDPDVRTSNIIVQYNYVHDNGDGILICGTNSAIVRYNVLYNNTRRYVRDVVDRGYYQIYNNIMYNTKAQQETPGTIIFTGRRSSNSNNETWEFKNNVFYNAHAGTTASFFDIENNFSYANNLYFGIGVTPPAKDATAVKADPGFSGVLNFQTGTSADTRFKNFDFLKPGAGSAMINTGVAYTRDTTKIDAVPNGKDYAETALTGKADIGLFASDFYGLSGIVSNMMDDPIEGAVVTLDTQISTTNASGRYSFATVSPGTYTITVAAADYMNSTTPFTVSADAVSWLPLKTGGFTGSSVKDVTGTITSGGSPLAGATVEISKNSIQVGTAVTGSDGTYTIASVPSGNGYTITASKTGYTSKSIPDFVVPLSGEPDVADIDLISETHVYYNEDFDTLDDWTIVKNGVDSVVEIIADPDDAENNLLHIFKSAAANQVGIYNKTNAGAYGIFSVETRIKRSISQSSNTGQYQLYTYQADKFTGNSSANPSANIVFVGGQIKTHLAVGSSTVTNMQAYTANTWYSITLRINTEDDTFDFYVDGVKKGTGNLRTAVDHIDIFNLASGTTGTGFDDFWVDYIKVYQGEPQFD